MLQLTRDSSCTSTRAPFSHAVCAQEYCGLDHTALIAIGDHAIHGGRYKYVVHRWDISVDGIRLGPQDLLHTHGLRCPRYEAAPPSHRDLHTGYLGLLRIINFTCRFDFLGTRGERAYARITFNKVCASAEGLLLLPPPIMRPPGYPPVALTQQSSVGMVRHTYKETENGGDRAWSSSREVKMNPPPAELLQVVHAGVTNPYSYTLNGALGLQSTQLKPDPNVVLCPTYLGKTEVMDSSSLLCRPGHVDQPYSSAGHTLVPTCIGPAYAPAHLTHINHLDSRDKHYNRQIQHHSCVISGTIVAATGPAKAGNRTFRANPSSVSQKKVSNIDFI
ncbi:hypothetical protein EDD16DRAFT_1684299 [Pisolithus croceorrhizus]|nr:hypothetical protein EDD16DRAFT_1684299 [Pisolithus croceorrhizus]